RAPQLRPPLHSQRSPTTTIRDPPLHECPNDSDPHAWCRVGPQGRRDVLVRSCQRPYASSAQAAALYLMGREEGEAREMRGTRISRTNDLQSAMDIAARALFWLHRPSVELNACRRPPSTIPNIGTIAQKKCAHWPTTSRTKSRSR